MILLRVRHGEASGEGDTALSDKGVRQAAAVAKKLARLPITKVYSSDYARAHGSFLEYKKLQPAVPSNIRADMREIYRFIVGGPAKEGTRPNRVEEDTARAERALQELLGNADNAVIAVFTHGNLIRYFLAKALAVDPKRMWDGITLNCGSMSVLQAQEGRMNVKLVNGVDHLPISDVQAFYSLYEDVHYLT